MHSTILHISGPRASGKTTLARTLARCDPVAGGAFLVRLDLPDDNSDSPLRIAPHYEELAGCAQHTLKPQLVFESVSETIATIRREFPNSPVIVETNAHPCFRHAFPWDVKVFIMQPPRVLGDVFRSRKETVLAIDRAMHDTAEFAAELYGLDRDFHDSAALPAADNRDRRASKPCQTVEEFLESDVGTEIASRLHLQPEYHAIIDSDVILLNDGRRQDGDLTPECAGRIEALLEPLRRRLDRRNWFAACDLLNVDDPLRQKSLAQIVSLLTAAENLAP